MRSGSTDNIENVDPLQYSFELLSQGIGWVWCETAGGVPNNQVFSLCAEVHVEIIDK